MDKLEAEFNALADHVERLGGAAATFAAIVANAKALLDFTTPAMEQLAAQLVSAVRSLEEQTIPVSRRQAL